MSKSVANSPSKLKLPGFGLPLNFTNGESTTRHYDRGLTSSQLFMQRTNGVCSTPTPSTLTVTASKSSIYELANHLMLKRMLVD